MQCVSMYCYLALMCQALNPSSEIHICLIIYLLNHLLHVFSR